MKQLFLTKGKVRLYDVEQPTVGDNEILVQVSYSFVSSGTENATVRAGAKSLYQRFFGNTIANLKKIHQAYQENGSLGTKALLTGITHKALPLGYACSGTIVAIGAQVTRFSVGDLVACGGSAHAYHAEFVAVPELLAVPLTQKTDLKYASIASIGAIALQGIRRAGIQLGDRVAIVGLGLIGQLTVQLAKKSGGFLYGIDIDNHRIKLAQELGCDYLFNPAEQDCLTAINHATDHLGVDITIITAAGATGNLLNQAMHLTRRKGKVILVGDVKLDFDREIFYAKEIDLLISCSYGPGRYDKNYEQNAQDYPYAYVRWTEQRNMALIVDLIARKELSIDKLIGKEFLVDQANEAYRYLKEQKPLGIMFAYHHTNTSMLPTHIPQKLPINTSINHIGVVGVGGFCKIKLLPLLQTLPQTKLYAVIDHDNATAVAVASQYGITITGTSYQTIVQDKIINTVVIATPHEFHTEQILANLKAGKAVFAEKPLAVTMEQYLQLETYLAQNPHAALTVDFNRSFAPFIVAIKTAIAQRFTPLVISYRMNVGHLSTDHWSQSSKNRGRIIGEACHIFDLFCFLTDALPQSISVTPLQHHKKYLADTDNAVITVHLTDGSVATLIFTADGSKHMNKEYMELFCDGKSFVLDDYRTLKGYGMPLYFNKTSSEPDKGHRTILETFFAALRTPDTPLPISYERMLAVTKLTLLATDLIHNGGGIKKLD